MSLDPPPDVSALAAVLDGDHAKLRERCRAALSKPGFAYRYGLDTDAYRRLVMRWLRQLLERRVGLDRGTPPRSAAGPTSR